MKVILLSILLSMTSKFTDWENSIGLNRYVLKHCMYTYHEASIDTYYDIDKDYVNDIDYDNNTY